MEREKAFEQLKKYNKDEFHIRHALTVEGAMKYFARELGYDENFWNGIRQIVVYKGLFEKFYQNPELREKLISTGNAVLAECSVSDKIWGIGLSMNSPDRNDRSKWKGQNLLGYALMMVRESLNGLTLINQ